MSVCYRRSSYVFLLLADLGVVDLATFFKGKIDVNHKPQMVGVSVLTGKTETFDDVQLSLLSTLDSKHWVPLEDILRQFDIDREQLEKLTDNGFLLTDEDYPAAREMRLRDKRIDKLHWNPYQAFAYMRTRWLDPGTDIEAPSDLLGSLESYEQLVKVYGKPAPHFHEVRSNSSVELKRIEKKEGIFKTLLARQTTRHFRLDKSLSSDVLSTLLFYTFGYHGTHTLAEGYTVLRKTSPSGGSLHPVEAYPLILDVEGVSPGIYHYNVENHRLDLLKEFSVDEGRKLVKQITTGQEYFHSANVAVLLTGRFDRNFWKYRNHQKALKVVEMDAAHLSQSFYLIGTELGLGTFVTAAVVDELIEELLGLPILAEGAMMVVGCGYSLNEELPGGFRFEPRVV